jgi:hypothetical protein
MEDFLFRKKLNQVYTNVQLSVNPGQHQPGINVMTNTYFHHFLGKKGIFHRNQCYDEYFHLGI